MGGPAGRLRQQSTVFQPDFQKIRRNYPWKMGGKNEKVDFSSLREAAKEHAEKTGAVLNYEGSDLELWRSVTKYFRQMLHSR